MATMYAIPALTTWNSAAGGWSNTSGGASNGTWPTSTTDVVFDANSGASRSIDVANSLAFNSINTTGAAAMTFTGNGMTVQGATTQNLTGTARVDFLTTSNQITLIAPNVSIGTLKLNGGGTLGSDLLVTTSLQFGDANFNANNFNVTCPVLNGSGIATATFSSGTGTYTLTGTGLVWAPDSGGGSMNIANCTIKITDTSASVKTLSGSVSNTMSVWLAGTGSGGVSFQSGASSLKSIRIDPGCKLNLTGGVTYGATTWTVAGSPTSPVIFAGVTSGTRPTITTTGAGPVYLDYCTINGVNGSPTNTFVARSSTDGGYNLGITFFKALPNFMSFF